MSEPIRERAAQIALGRGADDTPFIVVLAESGRIFRAERIWGAQQWAELDPLPLLPLEPEPTTDDDVPV